MAERGGVGKCDEQCDGLLKKVYYITLQRISAVQSQFGHLFERVSFYSVNVAACIAVP